MFIRLPLFAKAKDPASLIALMVKFMGTPTKEDWPEMTSLPYYSLIPQIDSKPQLENFFFERKTEIDEVGLDLVKKLLCLNPDKRISI